MGRLDEAHIELEKVLAKDPKNEEATRYLEIQNRIIGRQIDIFYIIILGYMSVLIR